MHGWAVLVAVAGWQADTVRLTASAALERAVAEAPAVRAATARQRGAAEQVRQAGRWRNPNLGVSAENIGAQEQITGKTGIEGIEGQAVLGLPLTLGGKRGAAIGEATARREGADATRVLVEQAVRAEALAAVAAAARDQALARSGTEEAAALDRFAQVMALRAAEGRASGGEAARAQLEATLAGTSAARRAADRSTSTEELARLLGLPPGTAVVVDVPACSAPAFADTLSPPEVALVAAQQRAAMAVVSVAKARRYPDIEPQAGLRRTQGFSGLFLGLLMPIPVLNTGGPLVAAAEAELEAAAAEQDAVGRRVAAERAAARGALAALDRAGARFTAEWRAALDKTLTAAAARYDAGEGTLAELLDSRRARLAALDDYERWRAERRVARARLARLGAAPVDATLLCDDVPAEAP